MVARQGDPIPGQGPTGSFDAQGSPLRPVPESLGEEPAAEVGADTRSTAEINEELFKTLDQANRKLGSELFIDMGGDHTTTLLIRDSSSRAGFQYGVHSIKGAVKMSDEIANIAKQTDAKRRAGDYGSPGWPKDPRSMHEFIERVRSVPGKERVTADDLIKPIDGNELPDWQTTLSQGMREAQKRFYARTEAVKETAVSALDFVKKEVRSIGSVPGPTGVR